MLINILFYLAMLNMDKSLLRLEKDILTCMRKILEYYKDYHATVTAMDQRSRDRAQQDRCVLLNLVAVIKEGMANSSLEQYVSAGTNKEDAQARKT